MYIHLSIYLSIYLCEIHFLQIFLNRATCERVSPRGPPHRPLAFPAFRGGAGSVGGAGTLERPAVAVKQRDTEGGDPHFQGLMGKNRQETQWKPLYFVGNTMVSG